MDRGFEARGGVVSPTCYHLYQTAASEGDDTLVPGETIFQVPVGHFKPVRICGVLVANEVDLEPSAIDVPPSEWVAAYYALYSADWSQSAPSGTC